MQGERNGAGQTQAKTHVTFIVLLLVLAFSASWTLQKENCESNTEPQKKLSPNAAAVEALSLPDASSSQPLSNAALLSSPSFLILPRHSATAAASSQGQQEAFDIFWKLLKIEAFHHAQEVPADNEAQAEYLSGTSKHFEDLAGSVCVEEMLDAEACNSPHSLNQRVGSTEVMFNDAQEYICVPGDEEKEAEEALSRTRAIAATGPQRLHFPTKLQVEGFLGGVNRGLFFVSCR